MTRPLQPPETVSELLAATGDSEEAALEPGVERMREAARVAADQAEETGGLGRLGRPMDRRSPFFIGLAGAAGVAVTIGLAELIIRARSVLVLIGLALFIAVGLDPAIPAAAALRLLLDEVTFRRLDRS